MAKTNNMNSEDFDNMVELRDLDGREAMMDKIEGFCGAMKTLHSLSTNDLKMVLKLVETARL